MENELNISTFFQPIPFRAQGKNVLVYELFIQNSAENEYILKEISVSTEEQSILEMDEELIYKNLAFLDNRFLFQQIDVEKNKNLKKEYIAVVYFWLPFDAGRETPESIHHIIKLEDKNGHQVELRHTTRVQPDKKALVIEPPLKGKGWLVTNGPSNLVGHRRTVLSINEKPWLAQRYASDWVQLNDAGKLFTGDVTKNENWIGNGAPIHAVADGEITFMQDGIIENIPLEDEMAIKINLQNAPGNEVVQKMDNGYYVLYAHMLPGSITVKKGDRVKAGDIIGKMGNTGNSECPHLHFHVGTEDSPLATQGVPYEFTRYEKIGEIGVHCDDFLFGKMIWDKSPGFRPKVVENEMPMDREVLNF